MHGYSTKGAAEAMQRIKFTTTLAKTDVNILVACVGMSATIYQDNSKKVTNTYSFIFKIE